jgi:hypothetical protein
LIRRTAAIDRRRIVEDFEGCRPFPDLCVIWDTPEKAR